ncbi:MAG: hypothetical protein ACFFB3_22995 [Candidatus Hodarchaeota archaeon]
MEAIVCEKFGPPEVLQLKEIDKPQPQDNEILARNYASSINTTDIVYRSGRMPDVISWSIRQAITPLFRIFEVGIRKP